MCHAINSPFIIPILIMTVTHTDHVAVTQHWLDTHQYTTQSIEDYEQVYGQDFVSPGGFELSKQLIAPLGLTAGQHVLDVGCGLGGSAFLMARHYQVSVTGIDLSENMLRLAREKLARHQLQALVCFELQDCLAMTHTDRFDVVHSRDVFLHIADKPLLFKLLHRALKPGGQLLFTDYACGPKPWHQDFSAYLASRNYQLHTLEAYTAFIEAAGFNAVCVEDCTEQFIALLQQELSSIQSLDMESNRKRSLASSWQCKLERAQGGDHRWIRASARAGSDNQSL